MSPSPSSPRSRSAGMRTSSNRIVAVAEPVSPIFRSGGSALRPSESAGTRKQEMPLRVVGGARHHLVEVRVAAVRGPGLGAVDDVLVAVAPGPGLHRRRVGAGVRLGEAVGAEQLAAEHVGQPLLLLLLGAPRWPARSRTARAPRRRRRRWPRRWRSPRRPGGRPRRAGRRRRTPRGTAARAARRVPACGTSRAGTSRWPRPRRPAGSSSRVAMSRVSSRRAVASSVGSTRVAGMVPTLVRRRAVVSTMASMGDYEPADDRYDAMDYRYCGSSGLQLPRAVARACGRTSATTGPRRPSGRSCAGPSTAA